SLLSHPISTLAILSRADHGITTQNYCYPHRTGAVLSDCSCRSRLGEYSIGRQAHHLASAAAMEGPRLDELSARRVARTIVHADLSRVDCCERDGLAHQACLANRPARSPSKMDLGRLFVIA